MFNIKKRTIIAYLVFLLFIFLLMTYRLPYYIYKPGSIERLDDVVMIDNPYSSDGALHLVTVSGGQATLLELVTAQFQSFQEVVPLADVLPDDMTEETYRQYQLQLMENSKHTSVVVAYEAANKDVSFENKGIIVIDVVKEMPADGILEAGDRVISIDGQTVHESQNLIDYVNTKEAGYSMTLEIERKGETLHKVVDIESFPDEPNRKGIGIRLMNDSVIDTDPKITFDSKGIGGPSAGLMFALEIYNQLTEEDITKGYHIVGTGEIDFQGKVHRIGGVDKKTVAAHEKGADIFFVPYEEGRTDSNYEVAKQVAYDIKSTMEIVPIDTFQEALDYLATLEKK